MNMKKTIAAIAAGAMAVSAMASSVSALELKDQVLSYNLVATQKKDVEGQVTLTATFRDVAFPTEDLIVGVDMAEASALGLKVKTLTLTGKYVDASTGVGSDTENIIPYTRNSDVGAENYDPNVANGYMVVNAATAPEYLTDPAGTGAGGTTTMNITVTAVCEHTVDKISTINAAIVAHQLAVYYADSTLAKFTAPWSYEKADDTITGSKYRSLPNSDGSPAEYKYDKTDYIPYDANGNVLNPNGSTNNTATKAAPTDAIPEGDSSYWNVAYAVLAPSGVSLPHNSNPEIRLVNGSTTASNFSAKSTKEYKLPFTTNANGNENIVYYLQNNNVRTADAGYTNVLPVINDAIANYGTVTFTFHTAAQPIAYIYNTDFTEHKGVWDNTGTEYTTEHKKFEEFGAGDNWGPNGTYKMAIDAANGDTSKISAIYTDQWYGTDAYTKFTQHLYNGTGDVYAEQSGWSGFNNEGTGFYGGLWGDNNLFGGALVINKKRSPDLRGSSHFFLYA